MKKLLFLVGLFLISSCGNSLDKEKCFQSVKSRYPNSKIYSYPNGSNLRFVVIDSSGVKLVKTNSLLSPKITDITILEQLNK